MPSKDFKITNKWTKLTDLIDVVKDTEYYIQNKGQSTILCNRSVVEPLDEDITGNELKTGQQGKYVAIDGSDLYIKIYDTHYNDIFSTITIDDKQ